MNNGKITYKPYTIEQPSLLNKMVDEIEIRALEKSYKGGGTSSYHLRMMLKVLVYAYSEKVFSSRRIAKALRENVNFMWLSG